MVTSLLNRLESLQSSTQREYIAVVKKYFKTNHKDYIALEDPIRFIKFKEDDESYPQDEKDCIPIDATYIEFSISNKHSRKIEVGNYFTIWEKVEKSSVISSEEESDKVIILLRKSIIDISHPENLKSIIELMGVIESRLGL